MRPLVLAILVGCSRTPREAEPTVTAPQVPGSPAPDTGVSPPEGPLACRRVAAHDLAPFDGTELHETWELDADGHLASYGRDSDLDGVPELTRTYTSDADGNRLTEEYANRGVVSDRETWAYDDAGRLVLYEIDDDVDGAPEDRWTYSWSDAGELQSEEWDDLFVGYAWESRTDYAYEDGGARVTAHHEHVIAGPMWDREWTYDAGGHVLTELYSEPYSSVLYLLTYTYDVDSNRLTEALDSDVDGDPEDITRMTYDASGRVLSREEDDDVDGEVERWTEFRYDADGLPLGWDDASLFGNSDRRVDLTYEGTDCDWSVAPLFDAQGLFPQ